MLAPLAMLFCMVAPAMDLSREVEFQIPEQPLPAALIQLSSQAHIQVVTAGEAVARATSGGVNGRYTIEAGLLRTLEGTGFQYQVSGPNTLSIVSSAPSASTRDAAAVMPDEVIVTGSRLHQAGDGP